MVFFLFLNLKQSLTTPKNLPKIWQIKQGQRIVVKFGKYERDLSF